MATPRNIQKELDSLRKEIAGLRKDYARAKGRASKTASEGADRFGAIRDELANTISAIKDTVANGTGMVSEDIVEQLSELRGVVNDYSEKTEKTVAAHPFAAVAAAVAIGILIGRIGRS